MAAKKKKNPGGRPTKYKPEYCQMLIDHMSQGFSFESFGGVIMVGKNTMYDWVDKYAKFSNAKDTGDSANRLFWEKMGIAGCLGRISNFNAKMWSMNMKNRFKWFETDRTTIDIDDYDPIPLAYDPTKPIVTKQNILRIECDEYEEKTESESA